MSDDEKTMTSTAGAICPPKVDPLPVVRTLSKTHEKPLGLVFLIFRNHTKRAILPNEITSMDTVKALFVRSFSPHLSMDFFDNPDVRIYIHDGVKDLFYDLENFDDIKDRSVLKLFEPEISQTQTGIFGVPFEKKEKMVSTGQTQEQSCQNNSRMVLHRKLSENNMTSNRPKLNTLKVRHSAIDLMHNQSLILSDNYVAKRSCEPPAEAKDSSDPTLIQASFAIDNKATRMRSKRFGKKTVSFDEAISYSDDPKFPGTKIVNGLKQNQSKQAAHFNLNQDDEQNVFCESTCDNLFALPHMYNKLERLHKSTRDLKKGVRVLHRLTQLQSMAVKDMVQDTYLKLNDACIGFAMAQAGASIHANDHELWRLSQSKDNFQTEMLDLARNILSLEKEVDDYRSGVINRKKPIEIDEVKEMALNLNKISLALTRLKTAFPILENHLEKSVSACKEKDQFLIATPDSLDKMWKRSKKLTTLLVTLERLGSLQQSQCKSPTPSASSQLEIHHACSEKLMFELLDSAADFDNRDETHKPEQKVKNPPDFHVCCIQNGQLKEPTNCDLGKPDSGKPDSKHVAIPRPAERKSLKSKKVGISPIPPRRTTSKQLGPEDSPLRQHDTGNSKTTSKGNHVSKQVNNHFVISQIDDGINSCGGTSDPNKMNHSLNNSPFKSRINPV